MSLDPVTAVADLASTYIESKDKQAEFTSKVEELKIGFATTIVQTKTVAWVDALIKLMYAAKEFIRPIASIALFFYGLTHPDVVKAMHELGAIGDLGIGGMFGSAPAWGLSRHLIESKKAENLSNP